MQNQFKAYYRSPIGVIEIISTDDAVYAVNFVGADREKLKHLPPVLKQCLDELDEYFEGKRKTFSVKLTMEGTDFQKKVWNELLEIPFGKTTSYLRIAKQISNVKSIRAVGGANGRNKIAIIIPCHRVIGSNYELVGYGGGVWRKKWLLEHEGSISNGQKELFDL